MKNLLKEPLVQFLVIAVLLLGGERLFNADNYAYQQYRIDIDNSVLLQFLQLQAKMFNPADAQAALDRLSSEERQRLIEDYGRNEALFREGIALNLDKNDQIIRSRVIQKMDYLLQGFYDEAQPLTENDLRAYFAEHQQEYQKPATATFTHVFISTEKRSVDAAKAMAETLYTELNAQAVPFENAPRYGERFLYNRNYVGRDDDEINSHFGRDFQETIFALQPEKQWQGPIQSAYGWHVVLLVKNTSAYIPVFEEIAPAVFADAQRQQQLQIKRTAMDDLMTKYQLNDLTEPVQ